MGEFWTIRFHACMELGRFLSKITDALDYVKVTFLNGRPLSWCKFSLRAHRNRKTTATKKVFYYNILHRPLPLLVVIWLCTRCVWSHTTSIPTVWTQLSRSNNPLQRRFLRWNFSRVRVHKGNSKQRQTATAYKRESAMHTSSSSQAVLDHSQNSVKMQ